MFVHDPSVGSQLGNHLILFFSGATGFGIVAHAVNTFPTPKNPYGQWFLALIQFAVGQRQQSLLTKQGQGNVMGVVAEVAKAARASDDLVDSAKVIREAVAETTGTHIIVSQGPNTPPQQ